jgi:acetylornithine deacetylase
MSTAQSVAVSVGDGDLAAAVAAEADAMQELLVRLVEAPTTLGNEEAGQVVVAEALRDAGLDPLDVPMDEEALRAHPLAAPFSWQVAGKRNVVATWRAGGGAGRSLVLNGHIDVVPPAAEGLWSGDPFTARRDGDWLLGRGSGDMKAGLAAIVGAVRGLRRLGLAPVGKLVLHSVVEEECGGNGALQCLLAGHGGDACVIAEPFPGAVTVSQVGVLWFHVDIAGIPAHVGEGGRGVNAIEAAFPVVRALRELEAELNADPPPPYDELEHPINLNIGVVSGGDWPSTVAAECSLSCRLALFPGQKVAWLRARVEAAVAGAARNDAYLAAHPPRVRYDGFAAEGVELSVGAPIVASVAAAHEAVTGTAPERIATTATTDARAFVASGIPAVCIGPHAERIHGVDERVSLTSMVTTAQVLALLVRDWCGVAA